MAGEYVEFVNNSQPALNEDNLNLMQQRIKQDIQGAVSGDTLPVGVIMPFGSDTIPENWLLCNGQAVNRTDYQQLFNTIGTAFGQGDGFTTFNVPNLKGKVVVGKDENDTDFDMLGENGGSKELQEHNHTGDTNTATTSFMRVVAAAGSNIVSNHTVSHGAGDYTDKRETGDFPGANHYHSFITDNTGTGNSGNLQPYQVQNYIIKAKQTAGLVATVVDNLTSTSQTDALSANQGKVLNEAIQTVDNKIYVALANNTDIDTLKTNGKFGIYNATGTLPSEFSTSDNNLIIECIMWTNEYGRQILHDVRTVKTFIRRLDGGTWSSWHRFTME